MLPQKKVSTLVFIDSNVEDYQSLISGVSPNAEVIILDETLNGIEQITDRLATKQNIEAIHIISHLLRSLVLTRGFCLPHGHWINLLPETVPLVGC